MVHRSEVQVIEIFKSSKTKHQMSKHGLGRAAATCLWESTTKPTPPCATNCCVENTYVCVCDPRFEGKWNQCRSTAIDRGLWCGYRETKQLKCEAMKEIP
jgi:hypothetical protein